jgi:hypothetical protein
MSIAIIVLLFDAKFWVLLVYGQTFGIMIKPMEWNNYSYKIDS